MVKWSPSCGALGPNPHQPKENAMRKATDAFLGDREWWRLVDEATHYSLTDVAHECSDETARALQYLALLCGTLTRDAGWSEDAVAALAGALNDPSVHTMSMITDQIARLMHAGYQRRRE
jgi:hypothetical protein